MCANFVPVTRKILAVFNETENFVDKAELGAKKLNSSLYRFISFAFSPPIILKFIAVLLKFLYKSLFTPRSPQFGPTCVPWQIHCLSPEAHESLFQVPSLLFIMSFILILYMPSFP